MVRWVRVCHFSATGLDGPYFRHLSDGFRAGGHEYLCGTLGASPPPTWTAGSPPTTYFALGVGQRREWPLAAIRLARLLRRHRVEVLQTHLVHAALVGTVAARAARTPLLVHMRHHIDDVRLSGGRLHVALDRALALAADEVVVPSHTARRYLVAEESIDPARVTVIHIGFDARSLGGAPGARERIRAELGLGDDFAVGCVARFSPNKGHAYLFEAVRKLVPEVPDIRLLLVGEGDTPAYARAAERAGIADRTAFLGHRADLPAWLQATDVVVLPSLSESFSQVIGETLAAGRPLVATDVGGAREVVVDGDNGLIVPPRDSRALHDAILRVARDVHLRERLAARGPSSIARFSVARMVRGHLDLYEAALTRRGTAPTGCRGARR